MATIFIHWQSSGDNGTNRTIGTNGTIGLPPVLSVAHGDHWSQMAHQGCQWHHWSPASAMLPLDGDPDHHVAIRWRYWHHLNAANGDQC
jgi:hypothetical protein